MTVDPAILPGLLLLALELLTLAAVGFVIARVVLRQNDDRMALAQGMVIGPAVWGLLVNFILHLAPGLAGAFAAWLIMLALGAGLAWHARPRLQLPLRTVAGFAVTTLALLWVALAARQLLTIPDHHIHLGLSSLIRAGNWPPITPWNPWLPVPYHYGVDMVIGLLAPPFGPDLAFTTELLGAYAWTSLVLVIATILLRYGGWTSALILGPLALSAGAWTLVLFREAPTILWAPVPLGPLTTELRASLADLYWPTVELPWADPEPEASPPNIWKPPFTLAYALALVVLERAANAPRPSRWTVNTTLAVLLAFIGLMEETVALVVLGIWVVLEAARFLPRPTIRARAHVDQHATTVTSQVSAVKPALAPRFASGEPLTRRSLARAAAGPILAGLLLVLSGGAITGALVGNIGSGLSIEWINDPGRRHLLGLFTTWPGGLRVLAFGPIAIAVAAALLGMGQRLALALALGSACFVIAALTLQYEVSNDLFRLDGHARNLALLALLVALAHRIRSLRRSWRYIAAASIAVLVVWPTIAAPVRQLGMALQRGVHLANAQPRPLEHHAWGRSAVTPFAAEGVRAYIRDHTAADARIFTPSPSPMSIDMGRPNASGIVGQVHLLPFFGPDYQDALRYLEPAAVRRLDFQYMHAPESWVASLPDEAQRRLNDPRLFELLVRDGADALYRIKPAFLRLDSPPALGSFEALQQAIPQSASVYLAPSIPPRDGVRLAVALPHARILGTLDLDAVYLLSNTPTSPSDTNSPNFLATPTRLAPSALSEEARQPVWWNPEISVYSLDGNAAPVRPAPPRDFSVQLSDVQVADGRIGFTATFTDRAADRWQGQDWVVVETDASPWRLPYRFETRTYTSAFVRWFDGQVQPVPATNTHEYFFLYEFEPRTGVLAVWDGIGYASLSPPQPQLRASNWMLAVRPNVNREEVGLIPVLHFTLTDDGDFSYKVYEGSLDAMLVR